MQTMKQRREKLLGASRPLVRPFDPVTDGWVLWAAYDLDSFPNLPKGLTVKEFSALVLAQVASRSKCLVVEDDCRYFKSGRGPACFVVVDNYGWRVEPYVDFFRWATPRMKLRCTVSFLQMARYSSEIGVCLVRTLAKNTTLFRHAQRYVMLTDVGRIQMGDPRGDEWLFSIKGSKQGVKNAGTDGVGRGTGRGLQRDGDGEGPASADPKRRGELPGQAVPGESRRAADSESAGSGGGDGEGWSVRADPRGRVAADAGAGVM